MQAVTGAVTSWFEGQRWLELINASRRHMCMIAKGRTRRSASSNMLLRRLMMMNCASLVRSLM